MHSIRARTVRKKFIKVGSVIAQVQDGGAVLSTVCDTCSLGLGIEEPASYLVSVRLFVLFVPAQNLSSQPLSFNYQ